MFNVLCGFILLEFILKELIYVKLIWELKFNAIKNNIFFKFLKLQFWYIWNFLSRWGHAKNSFKFQNVQGFVAG